MTDHNRYQTPVLGCIADDVTGATDLAINLVQGGMRVVQILGDPAAPSENVISQASQADAIVVALKTRSVPKEDAVGQSLRALESLKSLGIEHFYFKYCSTFDSTDQGNIGPVSGALMGAVNAPQTVFCPAFPRMGRTVYRGHLFVGNQLLSESGMEHHPLNPMTDANLVRVLGRQTPREVGLLSMDQISAGPDAIREHLNTLAGDGVEFVIADSCDDSHLVALSSVAAEMMLVTGGSGLARYLPDAYRQCGILGETRSVAQLPQIAGRSLIIAGSCSRATSGQVAWMIERCPAWILDVDALMDDADSELKRISAWAQATRTNEPLLVASTADPKQVADVQQRFGREAVAQSIEVFLGRVACSLTDELDVRRIVLAGGETSGAVTRALGIQALDIGPEICAGVPWTQTLGRDTTLALALKSGNFGEQDFFASALGMLP